MTQLIFLFWVLYGVALSPETTPEELPADFPIEIITDEEGAG